MLYARWKTEASLKQPAQQSERTERILKQADARLQQARPAAAAGEPPREPRACGCCRTRPGALATATRSRARAQRPHAYAPAPPGLHADEHQVKTHTNLSERSHSHFSVLYKKNGTVSLRGVRTSCARQGCVRRCWLNAAGLQRRPLCLRGRACGAAAGAREPSVRLDLHPEAATRCHDIYLHRPAGWER